MPASIDKRCGIVLITIEHRRRKHYGGIGVEVEKLPRLCLCITSKPEGYTNVLRFFFYFAHLVVYSANPFRKFLNSSVSYLANPRFSRTILESGEMTYVVGITVLSYVPRTFVR